MVAVPFATPVTTPPTTLATPGLLLLHVPPVVLSVKVVVAPTHTESVPNIIAAVRFTVTVVVDVVVPQLLVRE